MTLDVKLKPVAINFTLKDHIYEILRETILDIDIYDAEADMRLDERQLAEQHLEVLGSHGRPSIASS